MLSIHMICHEYFLHLHQQILFSEMIIIKQIMKMDDEKKLLGKLPGLMA